MNSSKNICLKMVLGNVQMINVRSLWSGLMAVIELLAADATRVCVSSVSLKK
jgi:hypothetical protein